MIVMEVEREPAARLDRPIDMRLSTSRMKP